MVCMNAQTKPGGDEPVPHAQSTSVLIEDIDPTETQEWLDALSAVVHSAGRDRGLYLLHALGSHARNMGAAATPSPYSAYQNTISVDDQATHPGDPRLEERITALLRWNALAMVVRANKAHGELGGHIASYASAAEIFE